MSKLVLQKKKDYAWLAFYYDLPYKRFSTSFKDTKLFACITFFHNIVFINLKSIISQYIRKCLPFDESQT